MALSQAAVRRAGEATLSRKLLELDAELEAEGEQRLRWQWNCRVLRTELAAVDSESGALRVAWWREHDKSERLQRVVARLSRELKQVHEAALAGLMPPELEGPPYLSSRRRQSS
eukprot:5622978-Pleurochrysis_carterae.AAC.1